MKDNGHPSSKDDPPAAGEIRQLLIRFQANDDQAASELLRRCSQELHTIAERYMRQERVNHTLQPTALVNEAYIRLVGLDQMDWQGKPHFMGMAARTMRRVLVDHARRKNAKKRGAGVTLLCLQDVEGGIEDGEDFDLINLNEALESLESTSSRQAQIVDLRFFGGLSIQETAATLEIPEDTVKKEIRFAIAWLRHQIAP